MTNLSYSVDENTSLSTDSSSGVLSGASDSDGDPLLAVLVSGPSNGSLSFSPDGSFSYTPNANFSGTDSFQYEAFDGTTYSSPATVRLTVNADIPAMVNDSYSVLTGGPTIVTSVNGVLANDSDPASAATVPALPHTAAPTPRQSWPAIARMPARSNAFTTELARFGPQRSSAPPSRADAQVYCNRLARTHSENFTVATRATSGKRAASTVYRGQSPIRER